MKPHQNKCFFYSLKTLINKTINISHGFEACFFCMPHDNVRIPEFFLIFLGPHSLNSP